METVFVQVPETGLGSQGCPERAGHGLLFDKCFKWLSCQALGQALR